MKKLWAWIKHPIRETKVWHYKRVIHKAAWILDRGLINLHISRAERRRVAMQARLVNVAVANERTREKGGRITVRHKDGMEYQTIESGAKA